MVAKKHKEFDDEISLKTLLIVFVFGLVIIGGLYLFSNSNLFTSNTDSDIVFDDFEEEINEFESLDDDFIEEETFIDDLNDAEEFENLDFEEETFIDDLNDAEEFENLDFEEESFIDNVDDVEVINESVAYNLLQDCYPEERSEPCLMRLLVNQSDIQVCDTLILVNHRINCKSFFAQINLNTSLCELINNSSEYVACISKINIQLNKSISFCDETFNDWDAQRCKRIFAFTLNNSDYCDLISDISLRDKCYFSLAIKLNDLSFCESLVNPKYKISCLSY